MMKIDYLCNHEEHICTVSKWVYSEFVDGTGSKMTLDDVQAYFVNTHLNQFPITFVAYFGEICLGTVSMFANDLKTQDKLTPWLASLYVDPSHRNKGIAEALIERVIEKSKDMGYSELYLRTEHTAKYYLQRGWEFLYEAIDEKGQKTDVFKYAGGATMESLTIRKGMTGDEEDYIRQQLRAYNLAIAPPKQAFIHKAVQLILVDVDGGIYGGLIGKIYRGCLFIDVLWVSESKRGLGFGVKLLEEAERIAVEEACTFVHLDTFSFQAPDFYQKNGYEIFGVLDAYADGIKRFYLKKML